VIWKKVNCNNCEKLKTFSDYFSTTAKVDCWGKGLRACFEHLRILNFAPDFSVCCGACLYSIGAEASID
jgi:hypothetical protein